MDVVLACGVIHNHIVGVDPNDPIMQDETCDTESSDRVQPSRREVIVESREWNNKRDEICQPIIHNHLYVWSHCSEKQMGCLLGYMLSIVSKSFVSIGCCN